MRTNIGALLENLGVRCVSALRPESSAYLREVCVQCSLDVGLTMGLIQHCLEFGWFTAKRAFTETQPYG